MDAKNGGLERRSMDGEMWCGLWIYSDNDVEGDGDRGREGDDLSIISVKVLGESSYSVVKEFKGRLTCT